MAALAGRVVVLCLSRLTFFSSIGTRLLFGLALTCVAACTAPPPRTPAAQPPGGQPDPSPSEPSADLPRLSAWLVAPSRQAVARFEHRAAPGSPTTTPDLIVAGKRVDPRTHGPALPARQTTVVLLSVPREADTVDRRVPLPGDARLGWARFSPDGAWLALALARMDSTEL
jgi:hypothetical protein